MFGGYQAGSKPKKPKEDPVKKQQQLATDFENYQKGKKAEEEALQKNQIAEKTKQNEELRTQAHAKGKLKGEELFANPKGGLDPKMKQLLQHEANRHIKRGHQAAARGLVGEQSQRGIVGKGGVGYAQQRDLLKLADEARGQSTRDLEKLDYDLGLKKLAAMFNVEQGEVAQSQLDRQLAMDELQYEQERKKQKFWEDKLSQLFNKV